MEVNKFLIVMILLFIGIEIGLLSDFYLTPYKIFQNNAPSDYITSEQMHFYNGSFCIDINNSYYLSLYAPSGSMVPTISERANGIEIEIKSPTDVHVGDIVSYSRDNETIIHRIIKIENTPNGIYYTFKGDANLISDPVVNYSRLLRKTIAIIY